MIDWLGFNGTSAQIGYIVPLTSTSQTSEMNEKADNVMCWEYIQ